MLLILIIINSNNNETNVVYMRYSTLFIENIFSRFFFENMANLLKLFLLRIIFCRNSINFWPQRLMKNFWNVILILKLKWNNQKKIILLLIKFKRNLSRNNWMWSLKAKNVVSCPICSSKARMSSNCMIFYSFLFYFQNSKNCGSKMMPFNRRMY